jgi:hypothetical protein
LYPEEKYGRELTVFAGTSPRQRTERAIERVLTNDVDFTRAIKSENVLSEAAPCRPEGENQKKEMMATL